MTPTNVPKNFNRDVMGSVCCVDVNGIGLTILKYDNIRSTVLPNNTPDASEQTCPNAAALNVDKPNVTPILQSIAFPACNITV